MLANRHLLAIGSTPYFVHVELGGMWGNLAFLQTVFPQLPRLMIPGGRVGSQS